MLPTITVFGLTLPMYGIMSACGMLAAFILLSATRKYTRFNEDQALSLAIWPFWPVFSAQRSFTGLSRSKESSRTPATCCVRCGKASSSMAR